jgi:hypothetical protein
MPSGPRPVAVELNAVLVALIGDEPQVLTLRDGALLPSGPFEGDHPTLQSGVRAWVERQTHHPLGYVEQLYTFADRYRESTMGYRIVSISYLGLTRERAPAGQHEPGWQSFYRYFPWEDWREGPPKILARAVLPRLKGWVEAVSAGARRERRQRVDGTFDVDAWNEELVLQRYELLYEAGLVPEAARDRGEPAPSRPDTLTAAIGEPMISDHRRILATGLSRIRGKIKYRPVVFELMPAEFTLSALQRTVEAIAGVPLHKQNFRRVVEREDLVEGLGRQDADTGGRPAELFRFRREILAARPAMGLSLPLLRE